MSEIQITKLVFGIFLSVGSAVLLLIAFKLYYKYLVQHRSWYLARRCRRSMRLFGCRSIRRKEESGQQ